MTPEQFAELMKIMTRLADKAGAYTITGAADWPILAVVGGLLIAAITGMWADLRGEIRGNRREWQHELKELKEENEKNHDLLWQAHRDCQNECCPRRKS